MKPRLILVSLGLACLAILSLGLQAQDQPKVTQDKDEIITSEQQLLRMFTEFQDALLRLKQRLARGNAEERQRAEVLDKVLEECKNLAINQEFTKMIELLRGANLKTTVGSRETLIQSDVLTEKLTKILDIMRDSKGTRLSQERKDLKDILDKLNKAIEKQKIVEAITNNNKTDPKEVKANQVDVTQATKKIADDIQKFLDKDKGGKGGEAAPSKGDKKDGGKGEGAKGEAKDAGKNKSSEGAKAEAKDGGKDSKDAKGETKPGQGKPSDKSGEPKSASKGGDKGKEGSPDAGAKGDKKGGDKSDKGAAKDKGDKSDKGKEAGAKDAGKTGDPKKDGPQGAAKGGEDKKPGAGEPKQGAPDSQSKPGGGERKPGGAPPPTQAKEVKGGDKGGEGKGGGEAKGGDGKQGETKPGDSKSGQGQAKDGGAAPSSDSAQGSPPPSSKGDGSPPPPPSSAGDKKQNDNVAQSGKKIEEAGYDQAKAEDNIPKGKIPDAVKNQGDAIKKMEEAKKKLEKLLQQMREEEIERVLAALQARCEKMLMMQKQVLAGTKDTHAAVQKNSDKKPSRENKLESLKLSDKEKEIVQEANKCIDILEAEGSAVAFPEVFQQVRQDMIHVQKRLDVADVHEVTQGIEQDIIDTLKEMIDALKKARDDNQSDPGKAGKPGQAGKPADPKLLELLQELKMVRSLQKRVNDRTTMYGKRYDGKEQAADPQIVRELRGLADRQMRIQEIVRRIAIGDNK